MKDKMINYKAVLLGIAASFLGGMLGGCIVGLNIGTQGGNASIWYVLSYYSQNTWALYVLYIPSGLALGWTVWKLEKLNLFPNLLVASTIFLVLHTPGSVMLFSFEKALLPLAVAGVTPFVFLLATTMPKTEGKKCTRCGAMNPTTCKFCRQCGTPLFAPPEHLAR
jgi:hypothetical protein